jgi:hypothetical protein
MHPLLRAYRDVLVDPSATAAMKTVAGGALLSALDEDIAIPIEYTRAAWAWLRTAATSYWNIDKLAEIPDDTIRSGAISLFLEATAGYRSRRPRRASE